MTMTQNERRWIEIQFYYFCLDLYNIHKELIDVITIVEGISLITKQSKPERIKHIAAKLLSDISSIPTRTEIIYLMKENGYSQREIAKKLGKQQPYIQRHLKKMSELICIPSLQETDTKLLIEFLNTTKKIKEAGIT